MGIQSNQFRYTLAQISQYVTTGNAFIVYEHGDEIRATRCVENTWELEQGNAELLMKKALEEVRRRDLRKLSENESERLQELTNLSYRLIKKMQKRYPEQREAVEYLKTKAICIKLGGNITPEILSKEQELKAIIERNGLHHCIQALGQKMQMFQNVPCIDIVNEEGHSKTIPWNDGIVKEKVFNREGSVEGYAFYYVGKEVLRTNDKYLLNNQYILTYRGIMRHNSILSPTIPTYDKVQGNGRFVLEIVTVLKDQYGNDAGKISGNHSFFILKDAEGSLKSDGKGKFLSDNYSPLGKKKAFFNSPDSYVYYPKGVRIIDRFALELTQDQYGKVLNRLEQDKISKSSFSLLKENCTTYIKDVLKDTLGIEIKTEMSIFRFFFSQIIPGKWMEKIVNFWNKMMHFLPHYVQKALHFVPLIYIPELMLHLLAKILSLRNDENFVGTDLNLFDIFFKPWNCYLDHPLILKESLRTLTESNGW